VRTLPIRYTAAAILAFAAVASGQRGGGPGGIRGNSGDAVERYRKQLESDPNSIQANLGMGTALDLEGKTAEARQYIQKAIDAAPDPAAKARAERLMAMSYAFDGDCKNAAKYEQMVFDYYVQQKDYYQQGEIADEAARVCIDAGDLDMAEKLYRMGHDAGVKQPDMPPGRKELWDFRLEHGLARIAVRRGNKAEAQKHIEAAKAALDAMAAKDPGRARQQQMFFPYLTGYLAYYAGDYHKALADFEQAGNDPFIQCMIGMTYEKLGEKDKAMEAYRRAAETTAHNPPAAFARPFARKKLGL
jgi:tetratricopeptide (TPR) repeat protein